MNVNSVSAGNVPAAGQAASENQTTQVKSDGTAEAPQTAAPVEVAEEPAVKVELGKSDTPVKDAAQKADAAKIETKLDEKLFQSVLKELGTAIEERAAIIKSLPPDVQDVAQEILRKTLADSATISEGMISTIKAEKSAVEQLQSFTNLLADAKQICREVPEKILKSLADLFQDFDNDFTNVLQKAATGLDGENTLVSPQENSSTAATAKTTVPQDLPESGEYKQQTLQTEEAVPGGANEKTELPVNDKKAAMLPKTVSEQSTREEKPGNSINAKAELPVNDKNAAMQPKTAEQSTPDSASNLKANQPAEQKPVSSQNGKGELQVNERKANNQTTIEQQQPDTDAALTKPGNLHDSRQELSQEVTAKRLPQAASGQTSANANEAEQQTAKNSTVKAGVINYQSKQAEVSHSDIEQRSSVTGQTAAALGAQSEEQSLENVVMDLAKQLAGNSSNQQAAVKNAVKQLLQQSPLQENENSPEAAAVKQTVENFTQNAPEILKFAAGKHNLPELPQLWALIKLKKALEWTKLDQEKLQQTIRSMREMTASMKKSVAFSGERTDNNSALSFSMPLYLGEGMQPYPAYIHLYHQREKGDKESGGEYKYETWLRICLATENIGPVDIVFRLYQENLLNVKVAFAKDETAQNFNSYLPDIREALDESALNLVEVSVNAKPDLGG